MVISAFAIGHFNKRHHSQRLEHRLAEKEDRDGANDGREESGDHMYVLTGKDKALARILTRLPHQQPDRRRRRRV
jgi:hypothetical protein